MRYWGIGRSGSSQHLKNITLFTDDDGDFSNGVLLESFEIGFNNDIGSAVGVEFLNFTEICIRFIRIQININWGQTRSTINEIAFAGLDISEVLETSTFAIFLSGIMGLAARRFKKQ